MQRVGKDDALAEGIGDGGGGKTLSDVAETQHSRRAALDTRSFIGGCSVKIEAAASYDTITRNEVETNYLVILGIFSVLKLSI